MNKLFNSVKLTKPKTNLFDLSHEKKLSCNMGELIPMYLQEVVPGDKFNVSSEMLVRLAPMVAPMYHRINAYIHYFFVPNRLVWDNWQDYITGGRLGTDASVLPKINVSGTQSTGLTQPGSLWDYLGLPTFALNASVHEAFDVSALPFRAYQLIYNEYYRDQNLLAPLAITKGDTLAEGEQAILVTLRKRAWEKDYFTSALPWTQRGGEVLMPGTIEYTNNTVSKVYSSGGILCDAAGNITVDTSGQINQPDSGGITGRIETEGSLDVSINELRTAARLQAWLERNALGGSRYIEQILAHFGVKTPDYRVQRPEYLGGGKMPITISEVLNTSATATEAQGNMSGHGIGVGNSNSFKKYFTEHGYILGIFSALPRTAYQQGIPRLFKKFDNLDYFFPEFANLGEQSIRNDEIYYDKDVDEAVNAAEWGYQSRYAEYKWQPDTVHGDFRDTMTYWHMGRIFSSLPALNNSFVESDPTHRVFAVTTTTVDKLYVQLYNKVKAIRPMPVFGTPGIHIV